ncbi:MAG: hypothetical protein M1819_004885 [Sarea resinae]|nr:MAG: hypothetical protein M1819_004885 [Sarea resinae]
MLTLDNQHDFILYTEPYYAEVMAHHNLGSDGFPNAVEDYPFSMSSSMDSGYCTAVSGSYEPRPSALPFSSGPQDSYGAPQFIVNGPQDNLNYTHYREFHSTSPSISVSHSYDNPPSLLSSASGASAPSASSSAMGSPYSNVTTMGSPYSNAPQSSAPIERWPELGQGLGIGTGIVTSESLASESLSLANYGQVRAASWGKGQGGFVGESGTFFPSEQSRNNFVPSSALASQYLYPTPGFTPSSSVEQPEVSIDTILDKANSDHSIFDRAQGYVPTQDPKHFQDECRNTNTI